MTMAQVPAGGALLAAHAISKRFGGLSALSEVSVEVRRGEIFGLIGPNGAGKTTLFNVLTGIYAPDSGEFHFGGARLTGRKPHEVATSGIARTFQNIRLFANMTALENVMVGRHVRTRAGVIGAIVRGAAHPGGGSGDCRARPRAPRLRRHRAPRRGSRARAALRRSAPPGDRPRAGDRPAARSPSTSRRRG